MSDVRLTEREEEGDLPKVCMCCGAPATDWIQRTFMMQPPTVHGPSGFREIYAIRMLIATAQVPRMRLRTSFCSRHRHYWKLPAAVLWGGLAGFLALVFGGLATIVFTLAVLKRDAPVLFFFVMVPSLLGLAAWIISSVMIQRRSIRAQFAPDGTEDVILHNVHLRYVEALEEHRAQSGPARQGTADRAIPEVLPGAITAAPRPARAGPSPKLKEDSDRAGPSQRLGLMIGGSVLLLLACGGCIVLPVVLTLSRSRASKDASPPPPKQQGGPNDPDPNEGPPPRGWKVLFRSDNPAVWNTDSPGKSFALPVRRAHSKIRYLRLTRQDTGEMLIVPITHQQLTRGDRPDSFPGHWWNGALRQEWGARHLGIAQVPSAPGGDRGHIGIVLLGDTAYPGSGFGWKTAVGDKQYYCWQGREIARIAFEVAVTTHPLTEEERRRFTGPDPEDGPPPAGWTVLFRSDDPSVWNTFSSGEQFAVPVGRAHADIHYLRLARRDTGEALVLPIRRRDLAREPDPAPEKGFAWCGSAKLEYGGRHLGIIEAPRERWPQMTPKRIGVMCLGWEAYFGSGFGHGRGIDKGQFYSWKGREIPRTAFEIAVTAGPLTQEDKRRLLK